MRNINWAQVAVFGLVVLVVFALGAGVLFLLFGGWGMMGFGGMRGGWCPMCGGTGRLGWLGGIVGLTLACLLPLGLLTLLVLGAVWLARNTGGGAPE
jgi:hypothetical protein